MSFSFCLTAVSVMPSIATSIAGGYQSGGPVEVVWTWIIASVFTLITGYVMAEMCSSYPSAGSVYHWAGQLAPKGYGPLASYVTGWLNLLGNAAGDAAFASGFASLITTAVSMGSDQVPTVGQQVGIAIAVCFVWSVINALRIDQQGWLNNLAMFIQVRAALPARVM